jgi:lycopene beta-cyclase
LTYDAIVVGAGPAGLAIAAALCDAGLRVAGLAPVPPTAPWPNTYGTWCDEVEPLGLDALFGHRWTDCVVYAAGQELPLGRAYGLLDNARLQDHLLARCERSGMVWHQGTAAAVTHDAAAAHVTASDGTELTARVVVDATGHFPALVRRPPATRIAYQAAYGIVGIFPVPPVRPNQLVLMDYRTDHLTPAERAAPPTFLYAMDLGNGVYFAEETSLAHAPAVPFAVLERRLYRRLAYHGVRLQEIHHVERCLFPMDLPLPCLDQPVLGFGGAASMVHPASGYQVSLALRRARAVAAALAEALSHPGNSPTEIARAGWQALWPADRIRKRHIYLLGLNTLLSFDERRLQDFFAAFFRLPLPKWAGYMSDTHTTAELVQAMTTLFLHAPNNVRAGLMRGGMGHADLLWRAATAPTDGRISIHSRY